MFKKILCLFLVLSLSFSVFLLPVSAFEYGNSDTPLTPSVDDFISIIEEHYSIDLSSYNYYCNKSTVNIDSSTGLDDVYLSIAFIESKPGTEVHITNNNASNDHIYTPYIFTNEDGTSLNSPLDAYYFSARFARLINGSIDCTFQTFAHNGITSDTVFSTPETTHFYFSDLPVFIGDENINRNDYTAKITYNSDSNSLLYQFWNHSKGLTFGVKCGIYGYYDFGLVTVDDNLYWGHSVDLQTVIDWAEDHDMDYLDMVAYMTIYDGINVVETVTCTISEALNGAEEEDGMFDEEKEWPNPSDYFSDPPDFPDLSPTPSFPGFDPEHPIDSIAEIIRWLATVIVTWIQNIIEVVKWVIATIVYYLSEGFRFLKDCFITAVYNLIVKLRALITVLAVPKKESLKERFNEVFPIFGQFKALFTSWGGGNQTITINLLGKTATINAVDALGAGACSVFYNLSTLMIGATTAFALFNIITSIFGISLGGHGGDE